MKRSKEPLATIGVTRKLRNVGISLITLATLLIPIALTRGAEGSGGIPDIAAFPDPTGVLQVFNQNGGIDLTGPFFQSLGTNGRSCGTCHEASEAWTVTPKGVQARFEQSGGTDPIFRTNDGSNAPELDVSTVDARRKAYSMLLTRGVIRVGMPVPANAEFDLVAVDDPYGHASAADLSLFRRPLPSTNLTFLSTVMWDGRETFLDPQSTDCLKGTTKCFASIPFDLSDQANGATLGHAQAAQALTLGQRLSIMQFESGLFTA